MLAGAAAAQKGAANIRGVNFLNYTYRSSLCSENFQLPEAFKTRKGKYRDKQSYAEIKNGKVVYGDLNGDGREEAIVHIACGDFTGNFSSSDVFVYTMKKGKVELLSKINSNAMETDYKGFYPEGFLVTLKGVTIVKGRMIVEAYADGSNAGPTHIATMNYELIGSGANLTGKPKIRPSRLK